MARGRRDWPRGHAPESMRTMPRITLTAERYFSDKNRFGEVIEMSLSGRRTRTRTFSTEVRARAYALGIADMCKEVGKICYRGKIPKKAVPRPDSNLARSPDTLTEEDNPF